MFNILKNLFGKPVDFKAIKERGALIIDVRTEEEFASGNIPGSVNIPLNVLPKKINDLKKKGKPLITVCRSGARSGMAKAQIEKSGIEVYNGGPWNKLIKKL
ncbi:rhodanese-like domain-containing protein [Flavihumibacter profundi]|jgi:phage shock protein E|uniref:rhodanese-like domain-containing protein n=1 Tax=Flavihumibacter profundi TaxID=2716883 RepID=UPI001CC7A75E|nr:rhodanese-like domain-containing protein [Flavihumibacter profundi]MBZ5858920.1 rhodanese-like domain-containing protein [Flavihumibacter profundi]